MLPLYATATRLAAPFLRGLLLRRLAQGREHAQRLPERWGEDKTPRPPGTLVWLHGASVGEAVSVLAVAEALAVAGAEVLITTGTVTSAALLAERLPQLACAERLRHRFVPLDVPGWIGRFLDHWRPDAAGLVESEIWPNLVTACRRRHVPLMLVNARLSEPSLAAWRRYAPGSARVLFDSFARIQPQSADDAARLASAGATRLDLPGNLKYAAAPLPAPAAELARLHARLAGRPIWLAASTHPGEEAIAAEVHETLQPGLPGLLTLIVPRHPERAAAIAAEMQGRGFAFVPRRSLGQDPPETSGLWLGDTMGELGLYCRLAAAAFVGKSLAGAGGQNPLEPARLGLPVAVGPHTENFREPVATLAAAGALTLVTDAKALAAWVGGMLADPANAAVIGARGAEAAHGNDALPARVARTLLELARARP
jgi:3-deoxy-D-manno-octulosonic-acid transferase